MFILRNILNIFELQPEALELELELELAPD